MARSNAEENTNQQTYYYFHAKSENYLCFVLRLLLLPPFFKEVESQSLTHAFVDIFGQGVGEIVDNYVDRFSVGNKKGAVKATFV